MCPIGPVLEMAIFATCKRQQMMLEMQKRLKNRVRLVEKSVGIIRAAPLYSFYPTAIGGLVTLSAVG